MGKGSEDIKNSADAFKFFIDNYSMLKEVYNEQWIAISNEEVVSHNDNIKELMKDVKNKGIKRPFITRVASEYWEYTH